MRTVSQVKDSNAQPSPEESAKGSPAVSAAVWWDRPGKCSTCFPHSRPELSRVPEILLLDTQPSSLKIKGH